MRWGAVVIPIALAGCSDPDMTCLSPHPPDEYIERPAGTAFVQMYPRTEVTAQCDAVGALERARACSFGSVFIIPTVGDGITYKDVGCLLLHEYGHSYQRANGLPLGHEGWL